jgi:hypothetical protein
VDRWVPKLHPKQHQLVEHQHLKQVEHLQREEHLKKVEIQ